MSKLCDLHTHSNYSDGSCTPAQLVAEAERAGLAAIALTDHNTVLGLPDFLAAGQGSSVETIAGIEFSTDYGDGEVHIVGLFIRPAYYEQISEITRQMDQRKEQSNLDLIEGLSQRGYVLDYEAIKKKTPTGQVNRALIAREMKELGYIKEISDAFDTLLKEEHGLYHPPARIDALELIAYLRSIGAVPVLAHGFLNLKTEESLRAFLGKAAKAGLVAMETLYPKFTVEQTRMAKALAEEFGLLQSGGSDYHGENKPDIRLGTGRGELAVPYSFLEELKKFGNS